MEESKLHADRAVEGNISDAELEHRALIDLTSLSFSFKLFYKRFHYEIQRASRYKRPLSMCLVAVDELEDIARVCGSHSKTAVIEHAARVLLRSIRDVDIAGRCREDCFGIILPETPVAGAEIAAVRIRTKMEQLEINDLNRPVQITVSIGGCSFPENGALVEELFAHTAQSLMSVVKKGGNSISFG
jgi:diguanylate cyclase (GGDEF)-like protein